MVWIAQRHNIHVHVHYKLDTLSPTIVLYEWFPAKLIIKSCGNDCLCTNVLKPGGVKIEFLHKDCGCVCTNNRIGNGRSDACWKLALWTASCLHNFFLHNGFFWPHPLWVKRLMILKATSPFCQNTVWLYSQALSSKWHYWAMPQLIVVS